MRLLALVLALGAASAKAEDAAPAVAQATEPRPWEVVAHFQAFMLLGQAGFLSPMVLADKGPIHLEARYNREDFETASFAFGWTFHFGDDQTFVLLVPMVAGVVGRSYGVVPGGRIVAQVWRFSGLFEIEYFFNVADPAFSFFNLWTELTFGVLDWLSVGGTVQHMQLAHSDRLLDWGPMIRVDLGGFALSYYFYGLWTGERWSMLGLTVPFF